MSRQEAMPTARRQAALMAALSLALLGACASGPPPTAWQQDAQGAISRYRQAALIGDARVAQAEFRQAREALSATGSVTRVARLELLACAIEVASLRFSPCEGFERLRPDMGNVEGEAERAYADYLAAAVLPPERAALLPADQRRPPAAIEDPLARLVASGVAFRAGRATPETLQQAVDTAAAQGWRRPLLAWLGAQALRAEQAGQAEAAARLRRRMDLVSGAR